MSIDESLAGLVLAGGYSVRFGERDKALAELEGTPMIRRVVDALATLTDDVVVNCRSGQKESIADALASADASVRFAVDPIPDRGPVAGVHTGLEAIEREYAAVVACDMPFVDPALVAQLSAAACGHDGAVVERDSGWLQPTQAVYRTEPMQRACLESLESAELGASLHGALDRIDIRLVSESDLENVSERTFESIDTRAALEEADRSESDPVN